MPFLFIFKEFTIFLLDYLTSNFYNPSKYLINIKDNIREKEKEWVTKRKKQNTQVLRRAVVPIGDERLMQKNKAIGSVVNKIKF